MKRVLRKWGQSLVEYVTLMPVFWIIGHVLLNSEALLLVFLLIWPFVYGVGVLTGQQLVMKNGYVHAFIALSIAVAIGIGWYVLQPIWGIVCTALALVVFYRGMMHADNEWGSVLPIYFVWFGIVLYFIGYFVIADYQLGSIVYSVTAVHALIMAVILTNMDHLKAATLSNEDRPPLSKMVRMHNVAFIGLTLLIIFMIAGMNVIGILWGWMKSGFTFVVNLLYYWLQLLLASVLDGEAPEMGTNTNDGQGTWLIEEIEVYNVFIIFILIVLIVLLIALIAFILYWFKNIGAIVVEGVKHVWGLFQHVLARIFRLSDDFSGYDDEKVDEQSWSEIGQQYGKRMSKWWRNMFQRKPTWAEMTHAERIRYLYRSWVGAYMQKGYVYKAWQTPLETMNDMQQPIRGEKRPVSSEAMEDVQGDAGEDVQGDAGEDAQDKAGDDVHQKEIEAVLVDRYNDVRYGEHDVAGDDVERVRAVIESKQD